MKNILTVDLEDWFSVETLQDRYNRDEWPDLEATVERNGYRILELLDHYKVHATFFVLGWIADRYPKLVGDVSSAGHEIGCHSYYHRMVSSLDAEEFRKDTELAIDAILKACGQRPTGYRSPSWGMRQDMDWAYQVLAELGFQYDSSIFPIRHDIYGDPGAPRQAYEVRVSENKKIIEFPASTVDFLGKRMPLGGGGWLRQFPYWFTRRGIKKLNRANIPAMVYLHPWEIDPKLPRVKMNFKNSFRQYGNLESMQPKLQRLLDDFDFIPLCDYINKLEF